METQNFKNLFEGIEPNDAQKERVWAKLQNPSGRMTHNSRIVRFPYKAAAAAAAFCVIVSGVGVNAATGGQLWSKVLALVSPEESHEDVVASVRSLNTDGVDVYAPEIFDVTDTRIIFGTDRGLVVYDKATESVIKTVDLQALGTFYFNSDTMETHVVTEGDTLIIYNTENGNPVGSFIKIDLSTQTEEGAVVEYEEGEDEKLMAYYDELWKKNKEQHKDTFNEFVESNPELNGQMYSKDSVEWQDSEGNKMLSYLYVDSNNEVSVINKNESTTETETAPVKIGVADGTIKKTTLPAFKYSGSDEFVKAACDYLITNAAGYYYMTEGQVYIPSPVIVSVEETESGYMVFGNYISFVYSKSGNVLDCVSGGHTPGCMVMERNEAGVLKVTEFKQATDGGGYEESIVEMCAGFPGLAEKMMSGSEEANATGRMDMLKMYIKDNSLGIKYYKDYGWDPVEIK